MKITAYLLPLLLISISAPASAIWVAKTKNSQIDKQQIQSYLEFQQTTLDQVPVNQREKLLENWFIRESLANTAIEEKLENSPEFQKSIKQFKHDLLAKLALSKLSKNKMPDFAIRAEEIYQAEKNTTYYQAPLLQVKQIVFNKSQLELANNIQQQLKNNAIDIDSAIMQYSSEPQKYRSKGLSYWFHKGQKPIKFYQQAEKLNKENLISPVFEDQDQLFILKFSGRKAEKSQRFNDVKDEIISKLEQEYIESEREIIINKIKQDFTKNVEINPEFLKN